LQQPNHRERQRRQDRQGLQKPVAVDHGKYIPAK
jgi:hypothetical protein